MSDKVAPHFSQSAVFADSQTSSPEAPRICIYLIKIFRNFSLLEFQSFATKQFYKK